MVSEVAAGGCREILIAGGDGSLHEAVNAIIRQELDVSVGVIPVGTGNDFVKSLGTPGGWRGSPRG